MKSTDKKKELAQKLSSKKDIDLGYGSVIGTGKYAKGNGKRLAEYYKKFPSKGDVHMSSTKGIKQ